jgi:uncharacterized protein YciI
MQFIIIARDYKDSEALKRRLASREAHIRLSDQAIKRGEQLFGAAMLNEEEQMCGSVMIVDFPSRKALDQWLKNEPYVTKEIWQNIEIIPAAIGPSFQSLLDKEN